MGPLAMDDPAGWNSKQTRKDSPKVCIMRFRKSAPSIEVSSMLVFGMHYWVTGAVFLLKVPLLKIIARLTTSSIMETA